MHSVSRLTRLPAIVRSIPIPTRARGARRAAVVLASLTTALVLSFAVAAATAPTSSAATWLRYHRGYSVQGSWLCYGWSSGVYHCTQHWYSNNGRLVSTNTAWVPNYGNSWSASATHTTTHAAPTHTSTITHSASAPASAASSGSVQSMIRSVFGSYAGQALAVAACESGYSPNAYNRSSGASGVFQFLHSTWLTTSYANYSPFNAWANINAAHQVFVRDGHSWREWSCRSVLG